MSRKRRAWIIGCTAFAAAIAVDVTCLIVINRNREPYVQNREEAAQIVIDALSEYYSDRGEYPPLLYGDLSASPYAPVIQEGDVLYWLSSLYVGNEQTEEQFTAFVNLYEDPLIASGYLSAYPLAGQIRDCWGRHRWKNIRWRCAVSTPGTFKIETADGQLISWDDIYEDIAARNWDKGQWWRIAEPQHAYEDVCIGECRLYALAAYDLGSSDSDAGQRKKVPVEYILHPRPVQESMPIDSLPYFGYQRGEWLGGNPREAWLWFYGFSQVESDEIRGKSMPGYAKGLDLISYATGELKPDGIPDGICLLYKLKDGAVVEVVRAEEI